MPAVIAYWQFPDEEKDFLDFLERTGNVMALPNHWVREKRDLSPRPIREFIEKYDPSRFLFGVEAHLVDIPPERREFEGEWGYMGPSSMDACLIAYDRPKFRDGKLVLSNLAAYWTCLDDSRSAIIDKNEDFVRWGKKAFAWVRKHTPEWHEYKSYRATKRVKDAIKEGTVQVAAY